MATDITTADDIIDSRDVIARIDEINDELEDAREEQDDRLIAELVSELRPLEELADEASDYAADWHHGEQLIHEDYFVTYMQELARDCGMISGEEGWPLNHIDWEAAAEEAKVDYTEVDFAGTTYYIR